MKNRILKKTISCLTVISVLFCVAAFAHSAFAETSVSTEEELRAAISAEESTIVMANDIKLASCLNIERNITLDLNGCKLYRSLTAADENGSVIKVQKSGALTLKDGSADKTGTITGGWANNGGGICNYGTLNIQGGNVIGNTAKNNGGGICCTANSKTEISNAYIYDN